MRWHFVNVSMPRLRNVVVTLGASSAVELPGPLGRHCNDILSYPEIFRERCEAKFEFTDCLVVRICDEHCHPGDDDGECDGTTFRRLFDSTLLRSQRERMPESGSVFHYQIVGPDEFMDVVCLQPPSISLRHFSAPPGV